MDETIDFGHNTKENNKKSRSWFIFMTSTPLKMLRLLNSGGVGVGTALVKMKNFIFPIAQ